VEPVPAGQGAEAELADDQPRAPAPQVWRSRTWRPLSNRSILALSLPSSSVAARRRGSAPGCRYHFSGMPGSQHEGRHYGVYDSTLGEASEKSVWPPST
jgi:hypothetical protein